MNNTGIHHVSSLVGNIYQAYDFYHNVLGLKLLLKTVNQEDSSMYHLFFGDEAGRVGTEFTIFDMPSSPARRPGSNALERTMFLVKNRESLLFWEQRLTGLGIEHSSIQAFGQREVILFTDYDGQELGLTYHQTNGVFYPNNQSSIPQEHAIIGIAGLQMRVREKAELLKILEEYFGFEQVEIFDQDQKQVISLQFANNFQHRIDVIVDKEAPISVMGVGSIHHIAFGVEDASDLEDLVTRLNLVNRHHTGIINRDFMHSLYFRAPNYLMFEVATASGQREAELAEEADRLDDVSLFLPSFLEEERVVIEAGLAERY